MAKKVYESKVHESGTWYKLPEYKVMLVHDGNTAAEKRTVNQPLDAADIFRAYFTGADREIFAVGLLDRKNNILGINTVSVGGLSSSIVHPREVFKPAIVIGAASIILAHNHPSGDPTPSQPDIDITRRLSGAGALLGIEVLDHVIVGDTHYSMKERGLI